MSEAHTSRGGWRGAGREALRSLVRMPKFPGSRLGAAVRAALAIGLPLGVFTAVGHQELGLQASAGAFTALYASTATTRERAKVLPFVALLLIGCAIAGVMLAPWQWAFSFGLVLVTICVCVISFAYRFGPPGPVFMVLVYGLAANITAVVDGERRTDPLMFLIMFAVGATASYVITIAPLVLPRFRRQSPRPLRELLPGPWLGPGERVLVARITVVAIAGTVLSQLWLDPTRAYWTVSAGVAVVGLFPVRSLSLTRGLHRTIGTVLGALLFLLIAPVGENPLLLLLVLVTLQFLIEFIVVRNYALTLVFVTPIVLFINEAATGATDMSAVALERVVDTVVGSAIAMVTVFFHSKPKPVPGPESVSASGADFDPDREP